MSSSSTETLIDVVMPQMGVSVSEGTIVEWRKQVGDWVEYEEALVDISTDKIDTELPSPAAGRVAEIVVEPGTTVEVGAVLARLSTDAKPGQPHASEQNGAPPTSEAAAATGETPVEATATPSPEPGTATPDDAPRERPARGARRYSPVVQRIAAEHDVDLDRVPGTGRDGRVRKQDVLAHIASGSGAAVEEPPLHIESPYKPEPVAPKAAPAAPPAPAPAPAPVQAGAYQPPAAAPLSRMRKLVGDHMKRSLDTAATCTTWIEADMSRVERARRESGLTALPFVARATIDALREYPALNAWLEGDQLTLHTDVNLGVAVSLGEDGLIVPVIGAAQDFSAEGLSKRIKELARAARSRALRPDDVQGGTFTITNPGQFGSVMATPVINQPQVAILDLEAVVKRPVVVTDEDGNDSIAIRPMTVLGLSWDHRALDGALAARFLAAIKHRIESL
ncbi:MAG TPA: dihydrolipoamide acetyltransferase family protein [Solirubrobacteraceae bacterium]|nr:dihydrolipoamide acetyltransferase family protein [Solirubrobacteraceae bacterium]